MPRPRRLVDLPYYERRDQSWNTDVLILYDYMLNKTGNARASPSAVSLRED
jgi:hypothetical protein